jgi:DUF1009 family protein
MPFCGYTAATCITVLNDVITDCSVNIQNTHLIVGHLQQGILLVNVLRSYVQNNIIAVSNIEGRLKWESLLQDKRVLANVRNVIISNVHVGEKLLRMVALM